MKKLISIITPCFNEEENVEAIYSQIKSIMNDLPQYEYEHIFIDNCSKDKTAEKLNNISNKTTTVKIFFNSRNVGPPRSG